MTLCPDKILQDTNSFLTLGGSAGIIHDFLQVRAVLAHNHFTFVG